MSDLVIGGKFVDAQLGIFDGYVTIEDGVITRVAKTLPPGRRADRSYSDGFLIFPGFVDIHTHCRQDPSGKWDYKETFETAAAAAINGGVVALADMPNNPAPPIDKKSYGAKKPLAEKVAKKTGVAIKLYGGVNDVSETCGAPFYKIFFLAKSVGDLWIDNESKLEGVFQRYPNERFSFHLEDNLVIQRYAGVEAYEDRRPAEAEISAIQRFERASCKALQMEQRANLNVCHVSTKEGLEVLRGTTIKKEVTPHHLFFDSRNKHDFERAAWLFMNPPLRAPEERAFLLKNLKSFDFLASDHAAHTPEDKESGAAGVPHLDTEGLFATWLLERMHVQAVELARLVAMGPGAWFSYGDGEKFGRLAQGYVGSLTVIKRKQPTKVTAEKLKTKCGWSPFEGYTFPGRVHETIIRGKVYSTNWCS